MSSVCRARFEKNRYVELNLEKQIWFVELDLMFFWYVELDLKSLFWYDGLDLKIVILGMSSSI